MLKHLNLHNVRLCSFLTRTLLLTIFILALALRLPHLNRPPYDAHPMRQTDTACVTHFFYSDNLNPLTPRACLIRPPTNTQGYFFLEFPLYQWLVALFQRAIGTNALWSYRVVNLALFSVSFWAIYLATKRWFSQVTAVFAVFVLSFLPSSLFLFGQAIHPDVLMLAGLSLAWYFLTRYLTLAEKELFGDASRWILTGLLVFLAVAIATRPFAALALPIFWLLLQKKFGKLKSLFLLACSLGLYGAWYLWQQQFVLADHSWQNWIFTGRELLLEPAWLWQQLIWKNVIGEVVGKVGSALALLGAVSVILRRKQLQIKGWALLLWVATAAAYWYLVPAGNLFHQYYFHVLLLPVILLGALGLEWLYRWARKNWWGWVLLLGAVAMLLWNGYRTSRYFYLERISPQEQEFAQELKAVIPEQHKLVYLGSNSHALSLSFRQGWTTAQPPADLERTAEGVLSVKETSDFLALPTFDDSFPQEELEKLLESLDNEWEIAHQSNLGTIYRLL